MNNIESIASRLAKAYRDKAFQIHPGLFPDDWSPSPETVECWMAVAEEAVRCRAEHFTDTVTGAAQTPKSDYLFGGLDQIDASRKAVAELNKGVHAAQEEAFRKQMAETSAEERKGLPVEATTYRDLVEGETIQPGDEYLDTCGNWRKSACYGEKYEGPTGEQKYVRHVLHRREVPVPEVSTVAAGPNPHYDWMTEARQIADKCLSNPHACPVDSVAQVISNWMRTAAQNQRNTDFYRDIVNRIGELFGKEAKTSDDGSVQQDVLALKVFPCVNELVRTVPSVITRAENILVASNNLEDVRKDQAQQIRILERDNEDLRRLNIHCSREAAIRAQGTPGTYGWALEAMKRGEAVRCTHWPEDSCLVIRQGVDPEGRDFCETISGAVYRAPGFDLHNDKGYEAFNPQPADQLNPNWEIVKHQ